MKFSLSWLKSHLDTNASLKEITDKLTAIGLELEGVEDRAAKLKPFTVAYVVEAKQHPDADRLRAMGQSVPPGGMGLGHTPEKPFIASMGVYVFSREVLLDLLAESSATDFGREIIPGALTRYEVNAFLFRGF